MGADTDYGLIRRYSLLIVDSSTALFCADYPDNLVARQTHLGKFLNSLKLLIAKVRVALYLFQQNKSYSIYDSLGLPS